MYKILVKLTSRGQIRSLICAEPIPNNILCLRGINGTNRPNSHSWFTGWQLSSASFIRILATSLTLAISSSSNFPFLTLAFTTFYSL
ncbi:hypothetical protein glysoja_031750 [Glycine soja]|uniref:Uncharacterized protein n=1 Tax=Glycine soja TaxID=3848 RepID=A0A0B2SQA7_GLYSO|nr:hypothetical protein glysoja_031750 [Glycine soja]